MNRFRSVAATAALLLVTSAGACRAESVGYYVARDSQQELSGGVTNPNFDRLTFLFNHGNHFHSIGRFGGGPNQLPESYVGGRITLAEGFGAMAGRFVSVRYHNADPASEYSDLRVASIHTLADAPVGSEEEVLYNSSAGRWSDLPLDGAMVALEVVELSEGLNATFGDGSEVATGVGDRLTLGAGDSFTGPLQFFTDLGVAARTGLSATFRLIDVNAGSPLLGSGDFRFDFATVPEPGSAVLVGLGLAGLAGLRWRRSRRPRLA
ncbi:all3515 family Zur-repressed PEP-CTERM protein [Tautonia plasticadhaerens]|uniref:PEP-CTERM motif protein n=1 Tax=Tautonia plasticadhaerens TaxID=2527974 RepID=A0A518H6X3_9BACT|nr:all3515 family Zur-repressed PEP-CTERM protein [Tautonia plasticadhaerens]QDV36506.1 PEP-CTERM motif protein [Tautonia plasticadhaerens]